MPYRGKHWLKYGMNDTISMEAARYTRRSIVDGALSDVITHIDAPIAIGILGCPPPSKVKH